MHTYSGDLMSKCCVVICMAFVFVSSFVYEIPRLIRLLVHACISSKDERDIPSKFGASTPALLYKVRVAPRLPECWC